MTHSEKVLTTMALLFIVSTVYAVVLNRLHEYYAPRWTIVTVVVGDGLIFIALWLLELWGVPLTAVLVFSAMLSAGIPIAVWQLIQGARQNGERRGREKRRI